MPKSESLSAIGKEFSDAIFAKAGGFFKNLWQDFIKFVKTNPQYLLCSIVYYILASIILGGAVFGFGIALLSYVISLFIAFSSLGEKLLRFFEHVRRIETKEEKQFLLPLFEEVYKQAKEQNPKLGKIELCIIDKMTVNACAMGKHTLVVTKGAIETFSADELKAMIAHEIAHILYGDTMARLYMSVGNGIFTVFVLATQAFIFIAETIEMLVSKKKSSFSFAWILIALMKFLFSLILLVVQSLMKMVLAISNRRSEFRADRYAYELGYGEKLVAGLYLIEKMQLGANATVIQKMTANHPRITTRIERLENMLDQEEAMQSVPLPLS
jgi:heat shock protein HtpX